MAKLTQTQIDDLKEKGFVTQVIPSADLADNTVDELKIDELITHVVPSDDIESSITVNVTSITLDKTELNLSVDEESTIVATVEPDNASHKDVVWTTSNEEIATVDNNGKVKGISAGTATITATAGSKTATCTITVA